MHHDYNVAVASQVLPRRYVTIARCDGDIVSVVDTLGALMNCSRTGLSALVVPWANVSFSL